MIVQSSRDSGAHLVLTMEQHTATGGTLATHYGGTGSFDRLEPNDLVVGLVREHDRGWVEVDAVAARDVYDHELAISRMRDCGATITTVESVLFEWLGTADRPEFKAVSKIVQNG